MKKNLDVIVAILTLIFLGMAFSAYVFVEPVTTITLVVGGVLLAIVALYGVLISIAELKQGREVQPVQTVRIRDQKETPAKTMVWEEKVTAEETQEGFGLSAC